MNNTNSKKETTLYSNFSQNKKYTNITKQALKNNSVSIDFSHSHKPNNSVSIVSGSNMNSQSNLHSKQISNLSKPKLMIQSKENSCVILVTEDIQTKPLTSKIQLKDKKEQKSEIIKNEEKPIINLKKNLMNFNASSAVNFNNKNYISTEPTQKQDTVIIELSKDQKVNNLESKEIKMTSLIVEKSSKQKIPLKEFPPEQYKELTKDNKDRKIESSKLESSKLDKSQLESVKKDKFTSRLSNLPTDTKSNEKINLDLEDLIEEKNDINDSMYFMKESINIISYIKEYYKSYNKYPYTKIQFYKYGRLVGKGAYGKVNVGLHVCSGKLVAIKSFNKNKINTEKAKTKILHETTILKNLNHPNVVKFYETFESNNHILIIMEYISCGDLLTFVRKRTKLSEKVAKFIFRQIIEALQYIHSKNIIHRDIKLDNILIDLNNTIKLCDFGVSKEIRNNLPIYDQCGTPAYIAPEILRNEGFQGFSADIWSAGIVLYAMVQGKVPFFTKEVQDLYMMITKNSYSPLEGVSKELEDLISKLLDKNPQTRITSEEILKHPWMKNSELLTKNKSKFFT